MSAHEPEARGGREPSSYTVAGYLAALALFAGAIALVYYPGRVGPAAMLVALLAVTFGGPQRRLAAAALVVATLCWFFGMVIAVALERPIF